MSLVHSLFGQGGKKTDTREALARELVNKEDIETKTDIPNAYNLSVGDLLAMWLSNIDSRNNLLKEANPKFESQNKLSDLKGGDILYYFFYRFRINRVSRNRFSRAEFLNALQQTGFESDSRKEMLKRAFGIQTE